MAWWLAGQSLTDPCPAFPNSPCARCRSNRPVHLTSGGIDATSWNGQSVDQAGMHVAVSAAYDDGSGSNLCESTSAPTARWAAPL